MSNFVDKNHSKSNFSGQFKILDESFNFALTWFELWNVFKLQGSSFIELSEQAFGQKSLNILKVNEVSLWGELFDFMTWVIQK